MRKLVAVVLSLAVLLPYSISQASAVLTQDAPPLLDNSSKPASKFTVATNQAYYSLLDFNDQQEAKFAKRGLIDAPEKLELWDDKHEKVVWSQAAYEFLNNYQQAPDTVNPSLWQNTVNNHAYGLFKVAEGIYQVRGYDMTNLTLVSSDSGWIVFDPLMSVECSKAAMQLVEKNLGKRPVVAVIISHPHVDHFGGIKGVIDEEQVADLNLSISEQLASKKIPIIVPKGFTEHAVSENVYAGTAMARRAAYQYGVYLSADATGAMGIGIGMGQSRGSISFIQPTYEVSNTGEQLVIDGINLEFQMTPGTEAPSEMNTYFPDKRALWVAENCTATLHNLYTLRGAQIRDGNAWAKYITETASRYGSTVEVSFQSHNWPHWGNKTINKYLENNAAIYKFIHDQTLTYINQGYTADEIARMIKLPDTLEKTWYTRQYYGTVAHNSKAVYQKYMGWYDANPVNLHPLTPTERAKKFVEYMGDTDIVLQKASIDFQNGEYQWVAEVTKTLIYDNPNNIKARQLCANALEQLGYQSESGTWRNAYLTAALELREGNVSAKAVTAAAGVDIQRSMTATMLFDYMSILLNRQAVQDLDQTINIVLTDTGEKFKLRLYAGILLHYDDTLAPKPDLSLTCTKNSLFHILTNNKEAVAAAITIEGDKGILDKLMDNFNRPKPQFNIIEP